MSQRNTDQEERKNFWRLVAFVVSLAVVIILFTVLALPEGSGDGADTSQPGTVPPSPTTEVEVDPTTVPPTEPRPTSPGATSTVPSDTTSTTLGDTTTTMDVTDTSFDHTDTTGP